MQVREHLVEVDVLVIGGGIAGCLAALEARKHNDRVLVVDKGFIGRSGSSCRASTIFISCEPQEDDPHKMLDAFLEAGCQVNDLEAAKVVIEQSASRIRDLSEWGVQFEMKGDRFFRASAQGHQRNKWGVFAKGGLHLMETLRHQLKKSFVRTRDRVMITELLTSDGAYPTAGQVVGAVGFHATKGDFYIFSAKAVVLTAGCWGTKYAIIPYNCTGDGQAMAFEAGAALRNMEFYGLRSSPRQFPYIHGNQPFFGLGGRLVNALGERFMERYEPVNMERAARNICDLAAWKEGYEGRGPVYLDLTHLSEDEHQRLERVLPMPMKSIREAGLDPRRDLIEWFVYCLGNTNMGGVRTNERGETNVPGLFCAGDTSDQAYSGAQNIAGVGLTGSAVMGHEAGRTAGLFARHMPASLPFLTESVSNFKKTIYAPLQREKGPLPDDLFAQLRSIVQKDVSPVKQGSKLKEAIAKVEAIEEEILSVRARDIHELVKANEARKCAPITKLSALASLTREESRGRHSRIDFPDTRPEWHRWVILKNNGNGGHDVGVEFSPIPSFQGE